jgi:hypothetical protein
MSNQGVGMMPKCKLCNASVIIVNDRGLCSICSTRIKIQKTTQKDYLSKFKSILDSMYDTTLKKNGDYADEKDAFSNFRIVEEMTAGKISTEMGIFTRMSDKFKRIASLLGRPGLVLDEKIEDTLLDLAVYCIIMLLYLREKAGNES